MKPRLTLFSVFVLAVLAISLGACKKENPSGTADYRTKYVGMYRGTTVTTTTTNGSTASPVVYSDSMEVKTGPYPDKIRVFPSGWPDVDGIIFPLPELTAIFQGSEGLECDTASGSFSSGGMHYELEQDCNLGSRFRKVFLGSKNP